MNIFQNQNFQKKSFWQNNKIERYSTQNEGKSVVVERFFRILKNKIYKYMTSISKKVYIVKFDVIVNKYKNIYHKTTKMKPADVDRSMHIDFNKENNEEGPEVKVANNVGISIYKNILQNISFQYGLDLKVKNSVPWTYVISDLNGEKIVRTFYEKEFQEFRKDGKLYVQWKGDDNSFNS